MIESVRVLRPIVFVLRIEGPFLTAKSGFGQNAGRHSPLQSPLVETHKEQVLAKAH